MQYNLVMFFLFYGYWKSLRCLLMYDDFHKYHSVQITEFTFYIFQTLLGCKSNTYVCFAQHDQKDFADRCVAILRRTFVKLKGAHRSTLSTIKLKPVYPGVSSVPGNILPLNGSFTHSVF